MEKTLLFLILSCIFFPSCDKGCADTTACNYGVAAEECKYANEAEAYLIGSWNLVDIHDANGQCIFSFESPSNCEYDQVLQFVNITFNDDKSCFVYTGPPNLSSTLPVGEWSINICKNMLNFSNNNQGYDPYLYPDYLPFGNQNIVQLTWNVFICEDLAGNTLRWEKI